MDEQEIKNRIDNLSSEIIKLKRLLKEQNYKVVLKNGKFIVKKNKDYKDGMNTFSSKEVAEQAKEKLNFTLQVLKCADTLSSDEMINSNKYEHIPAATRKVGEDYLHRR